MSGSNGASPGVVLVLDRERPWKLDLPAFERACDGFDEVGMPDFAENPFESLRALGVGDQDRLVMNRRVSKILRVWIWAGLTGDDADLKLADVSKQLTVGKLTRFAIQVIPALTDAIMGPPAAAAEEQDSGAVATGLSAASVSG